ncbi:sodium/hydrogen exchanger [Capsaspora owczarzaki ATCC 30864]|uniref:Sodium/hydrogen exchanger n=1 Tax=Capsaspora owczarzaki (strain ATCC 30864) TaxID=595528 RepID=A0A0D2VYC2_CAPO3|nr:sodium/hydrogen exchanger [Capsaspora owczarzaki ATCC 30864]KJE96707.1 sodium/hydrogen exchanger [Capsaspora owczarzaki ATCC 30864]|eukprot:XP_004343708.1 sodium/hydrogen exchanger [Capsaspora owczarzaki ATCC 30864]
MPTPTMLAAASTATDWLSAATGATATSITQSGANSSSNPSNPTTTLDPHHGGSGGGGSEHGAGLFEGGNVLATPYTLFVIQLLIIVSTSRILAVVLRKLKQPLVVAEILSGVLLGPSAFGKVESFRNTIFPASSMTVLSMFANVGLVLFMFMIGLELDIGLLTKNSRNSIFISATGISCAAILGCFVGYVVHDVYAPDTNFLTFMLFLGVAMAITAFPVLARILAERKLLNTRVGMTTIGAAAIDDVTAWCFLALVVSIAHAGGNPLTALYTILTAVALILFLVLVARRLIIRGLVFLKKGRGLSHITIVLSFLLMFLCSFLTEIIGIHAIFGAFAFGVILPRDTGLPHLLIEKIEDLTLSILIPLYFTVSGLRTDLFLVADAKALGFTLLIISATCTGKLGGCSLAARKLGNSWRMSITTGILMNTKGLVELVVLNIGLDAGIITPTVFTMCVIMALVTTFMTTPLTYLAYPPHLVLADAVSMSAPQPHQQHQQQHQQHGHGHPAEDVDFSPMSPNSLPNTRLCSLVYSPDVDSGLSGLTIALAISKSRRKRREVHVIHMTEMTECPSSFMRYMSSNDSLSGGQNQIASAVRTRAKILGMADITQVITFSSNAFDLDLLEAAKTLCAHVLVLPLSGTELANCTNAVRVAGSEVTLDAPKGWEAAAAASGDVLPPPYSTSSDMHQTIELGTRENSVPSQDQIDSWGLFPALPVVVQRVLLSNVAHSAVVINRSMSASPRRVLYVYTGSPADLLGISLLGHMAKLKDIKVYLLLADEYAELPCGGTASDNSRTDVATLRQGASGMFSRAAATVSAWADSSNTRQHTRLLDDDVSVDGDKNDDDDDDNDNDNDQDAKGNAHKSSGNSDRLQNGGDGTAARPSFDTPSESGSAAESDNAGRKTLSQNDLLFHVSQHARSIIKTVREPGLTIVEAVRDQLTKSASDLVITALDLDGSVAWKQAHASKRDLLPSTYSTGPVARRPHPSAHKPVGLSGRRELQAYLFGECTMSLLLVHNTHKVLSDASARTAARLPANPSGSLADDAC